MMKIKRVKGFSLAEVLVSLGLIAMIMSIIMFLTMRAANDFIGLHKANNEFYMLELVQDSLTNAIKNSKDLEEVQNGYILINGYGDTTEIVVENGMLIIDGEVIMGADKIILRDSPDGFIRVILTSAEIINFDAEIMREAFIE